MRDVRKRVASGEMPAVALGGFPARDGRRLRPWACRALNGVRQSLGFESPTKGEP
jgi:hypothetical protein